MKQHISTGKTKRNMFGMFLANITARQDMSAYTHDNVYFAYSGFYFQQRRLKTITDAATWHRYLMSGAGIYKEGRTFKVEPSSRRPWK
jgi:hypothetical protein